MKANHKIMAVLAGIALTALTIIVPGDAAQAQDTVRVRGTIASIDGATYVIKARDGTGHFTRFWLVAVDANASVAPLHRDLSSRRFQRSPGLSSLPKTWRAMTIRFRPFALIVRASSTT
jgi:hypothetical protein